MVFYINSYDVHDWDLYKQYAPRVIPILNRYGAKVLAADTAALAVEGNTNSMHAVIRFPSRAAALACYQDAEYQEAKEIRHRSCSNCTMVLVEEITE
jgi:uncharacterized protein (DUF1330 family)